MKILAIETTDPAGSAALIEGRRIVAEMRLTAQQRSAQSLAPAIRDLLETAAWKPSEIGLVAVAIGPGSFTGLRVGVTTAKTFSYAVGCDVVAVPTLEVIAAQAAGHADAQSGDRKLDGPRQILTVLDAGRQQVFSARFRLIAEGRLECIEPTALMDDAAWLAGLQPGECISGPGLKKFAGRLPARADVVPSDVWAPRAATVGQLGLDRFEAGQRDDLWRLVPLYHRASAAEEKQRRGC
jgi:tRNA threonylcarbamoyladenosine biosynthesis protein TsaB